MELRGALQVARSDAVRRSEDIKLKKIDAADGRSCAASPADWSCGWIVFRDENGDGAYTVNSEDELLQTFPAPSNTSVRFTSNATYLTVNRWGAINGVGASFVISPQSPLGSTSGLEMAVCVSSGGRIRWITGSSCS
ncbi:GspH/FimT family protein [Diaphorobacter aerolatus]|uniref:GspH/FimT family protein n=1 Tax=Diaphorobacter aerolatus TaxID=1288495 RepID=A0A7H0GH32_9BURK|nr:GspH/FimT family protein [Diaphorobacter aerolatus]QNP47598.1 GspH/FimT family protein [Diaphorobacter aerolatus]